MTKIYPKFHLRWEEFLTKTHFWLEFLTKIARWHEFLTFDSKFALRLHESPNFSLLILNFSLCFEILTIMEAATPTPAGRDHSEKFEWKVRNWRDCPKNSDNYYYPKKILCVKMTWWMNFKWTGSNTTMSKQWLQLHSPFSTKVFVAIARTTSTTSSTNNKERWDRDDRVQQNVFFARMWQHASNDS